MRFRKYLSTQYADPDNHYINENGKKVAMPILSIYFLGYPLEKIKTPVIRVNREYIDAATKKKISDKEEFIESLTHDSIVIQIPYLKEHRRTTLERVLSVFEPSKQHMVNINEENYPKRYRDVIRRLVKAAVEPEIRDAMDIEDEIVEELKEFEHKLTETEKRVAELADEKCKAEKERRRAEEEKRRAEEEKRKAEEREQRIEEEKRRAEEEKRRAEERERRAKERECKAIKLLSEKLNLSSEEIQKLLEKS